MKRRRFIQALLGLAGTTTVPINQAIATIRPKRIQLQQCELAGFQYYQGERLYPQIKTGDKLTLKRAPQNPYDKRAVEVYWQNNMLGHIPSIGNMAISQMLDRGEPLSANITQLSKADNPWQKVKLAVYWNQHSETPAPSQKS